MTTSLPSLQAAVGAWHRERWGIADRIMMAAKLAEEVGEVCEAAVKQAQGHPDAADLDYGAELGDVVIVALAAADLAGYNLTDTVLVKLARLGALGHRHVGGDG